MRHRLFTALPYPEDLRAKIQLLRSKIPYQLNWLDPQRYHLTLNFLGNITDDQLPSLQKNILHALSGSTPFKIHLGFLQSIYRKHEGSYICLTPDQKSEELIELQDRLRDSLYHFNIPIADRFWPHLTIATLPKSDPVTTKALLDKIDSLDLRVRFTWPVEKVVLYESTNDRTGTHYSRVATYPLT